MSRRYVISSAAHSLYSLSPFLRGEGWGEGCDPRGSVCPSPPPSPRSKSGERESGLSTWQGCGSTSAERALVSKTYTPDHYRGVLRLHVSPLCGHAESTRAPLNAHSPKALAYDRQGSDDPYRSIRVFFLPWGKSRDIYEGHRKGPRGEPAMSSGVRELP